LQILLLLELQFVPEQFLLVWGALNTSYTVSSETCGYFGRWLSWGTSIEHLRFVENYAALLATETSCLIFVFGLHLELWRMSQRLDSIVMSNATIFRRRLGRVNHSAFFENLMRCTFGKVTWVIVATSCQGELADRDVRSTTRVSPVPLLFQMSRKRLRWMTVELTVRLLLFSVFYFGYGVQNRWSLVVSWSTCLLVVNFLEFRL
jgi:hypothetical protein